MPFRTLLTTIAAMLLASSSVSSQTVGVTDDSIKIGHTNPYSGPASVYSVIGKTIVAYFKGVNADGGIMVARLISFPWMIVTVHRVLLNKSES